MLGVWFCVLQTARNKSLIVKDIVFLVPGSLFGVLSIGVWDGADVKRRPTCLGLG